VFETYYGTGPVASIERSNDGGGNWSKSRKIYYTAGPVHFRDRIHGYLTVPTYGFLTYSGDGGREWAPRPARPPSGYPRDQSRRRYALPTFAGNHRILPVSLVRHGREDIAFYSNHVGPGPWHLTSLLHTHLFVGKGYFNEIGSTVVSPTRWWVFYGRGAHVAITRDGGATWVERKTGLIGTPATIGAVGGRTAWATITGREHHRRLLYLTRSSGRRWRRLRPWR
jgi:photosystem II stability/assembly factor-like uncharacterized protein